MEQRRAHRDRDRRRAADLTAPTRRHPAQPEDHLGRSRQRRSLRPIRPWLRGAQLRHQAHIRAGGIDKDVVLVETDDMDDQIDAAYHTKYRRYTASIIDAILSPEARAATLRLVP